MPRGRKKEFERYYVHGRTSFLQKQRERLAALAEQRKKEATTSLRKNRQFMSRVEFLEYMEAAEDHLGKLKSITYYVEGMKRLLWLNMQLSAELRKWEGRWKKLEEKYLDEINRLKEEAAGHPLRSGTQEDKCSGEKKQRALANGLWSNIKNPVPRYEAFASEPSEEAISGRDRDALVAHRRALLDGSEQRRNRRRGGKSFAVGVIKVDRAGAVPGDGVRGEHEMASGAGRVDENS